MSYASDKARLPLEQRDRAPSAAELDAESAPAFLTHRYACGGCGGRFIAPDVRDRHAATCPATDPWMLDRTRA